MDYSSCSDWVCEIRPHTYPGKRFFDLSFAVSVLLLGSPLYLFIALLVKYSAPGPIFFGHTRIGQSGRPFKCYKFRTMYVDAETRLKEILARDPEKKAEWEASFKLKEDPRVTALGRFLRKTSLDELPQFWNVIRGELSVVGPRPVVQKEIEQYFGQRAIKVLSVRPGLTCLWQVAGRSDTSYETRIALDERYVDEQSIWLDLKLIFQTIPAMLFSKGAY